MCLTEPDISAIAGFLQMGEKDFINTYCRLQRTRCGLSLIDDANGACIMLGADNACRIQPVKPRQCRDFPLRWNFPGWETRCPAAVNRKGGPAVC